MPFDLPSIKSKIGNIVSKKSESSKPAPPLGGMVNYALPASFYIAEDTVKLIAEAERSVFNPNAYAKYLEDARAKEDEFDKAEASEVPLNAAGENFLRGGESSSLGGARSGNVIKLNVNKQMSESRVKIIKKFDEAGQLHQSYLGIIKALDYVEETGRIRRGVVTNLRQPDIASLLIKAEHLSQKVRAMHTNIISRDRLDKDVSTLEERIVNALKMSVKKNYIKNSGTNYRKLFDNESPQQIYIYIDSKIQELAKLKDYSKVKQLAYSMKCEYLQPMADSLDRYLMRAARKNPVPSPKMLQLQDVLICLNKFLQDDESRWDTKEHPLSIAYGHEPASQNDSQETLYELESPSGSHSGSEPVSANLSNIVHATLNQYDPQEVFELSGSSVGS